MLMDELVGVIEREMMDGVRGNCEIDRDLKKEKHAILLKMDSFDAQCAPPHSGILPILRILPYSQGLGLPERL